MAVQPGWDGVNPGRYRLRIDIVQDVITRVKGVETRGPASVGANVPSALYTLSGNELIRAQAIDADIRFRWEMRHRPAIKADARITYGTRKFRVLWPVHDEMHKVYTHCFCAEITQ